jgi:cation transport regulator ChaB
VGLRPFEVAGEGSAPILRSKGWRLAQDGLRHGQLVQFPVGAAAQGVQNRREFVLALQRDNRLRAQQVYQHQFVSATMPTADITVRVDDDAVGLERHQVIQHAPRTAERKRDMTHRRHIPQKREAVGRQFMQQLVGLAYQHAAERRGRSDRRLPRVQVHEAHAHPRLMLEFEQ